MHAHTVKPFEFKNMTKEKMVQCIDQTIPISLKNHEDLIDRIHVRYPLITKAEVGIIVSAIFYSIREFMVLGYVQNYFGLLVDLKLRFFARPRRSVILSVVKVSVATPPKLRG
jgi:hypothetical protein